MLEDAPSRPKRHSRPFDIVEEDEKVKEESIDGLRSGPLALPTLVESTAPQASIKAGDWMTEVSPLFSMADGRPNWETSD